MHVRSALIAMEKRGTFKAYKDAHKAYVEQCNVTKQAKVALALFTAPTRDGKKAYKKASKKASEKASEKEPAKNSASKKTKEGAALADTPAPNFVMSTRPSRTRPFLQKRPPRTRKKPLQLRCFSST